MERRLNTLRKYQEKELHDLVSRDCSSFPLCNIGLTGSVRGDATLVVTKPEKCQLIHPPAWSEVRLVSTKTLVPHPLPRRSCVEASPPPHLGH